MADLDLDEKPPTTLVDLHHDCLTLIAQLVPAHDWPRMRAACRDLRAAVRDATTGLLIDLRALPFSEPTTTTASPPDLPSDRRLLSRVREVRMIMHKDRDEPVLTDAGLGDPEACPVALLLEEIGRARGAACGGEGDGDAPPLPPARVSLCLRAPRGAIAVDRVTHWLRSSGIAARVNGALDVRADGAVLGRDGRGCGAGAWRGLHAGCRLAVEAKLSCSGSSPLGVPDGGAVVASLAGAPVASLSVLAFSRRRLPETAAAAAAATAAAAAAARTFRLVRALSGTLEELRLGETVPAVGVRAALAGDGEDRELPRCRWPKLRRLVLHCSPDEGQGDDDGGSPLFPRPEEGGDEGDERGGQPRVLFPSLETLACKREHAGAWLRRFGDAIDPSRVVLERL